MKINELLNKKVSRRKFLAMLGGAVTVPFFAKYVSAQGFLRKTDGTFLNIDNLEPGLWEVSGGNTQLVTPDDILIQGTDKIFFGDSGTFIHQSSDGNLLIEADIKVTIGVAGDIELGDSTERDMFPNTDAKVNVGTITKKFNKGYFEGIVDCHTGGVRTLTDSDATISNPPTDAQLDSILGAPNTLGSGWSCFLEDTTDNDYWFIITDGTSWYVEELTKAV